MLLNREMMMFIKPSLSIYRSYTSLSRVDTTLFNIQRDCFICGKASTRPEHLTAIMTGTGKSTRDKVLHATSERLMKLCIICKYHKSCLKHYISKQNIAAARRKQESEQQTSIYDKAFIKLTEVIDCFL